MSPDDLSRALVQPGRASIPYLDRYIPDRPLVLECFRPQGHNPDKPVDFDQLKIQLCELPNASA